MTNAKTVRLTGSIFTVEPTLGSPQKLAGRLRELCSTEDVLRQLSPLPLDTPKEAPDLIPRALLVDVDQKWQMQCSAARVILSYQPSKEEESGKALPPEAFWQLCGRLLPACQRSLGLDVWRLACVQDLLRSLERDATGYLVSTCLASTLPALFRGELRECEVKANRRGSWPIGSREYPLNRLVTLSAMRTSTSPAEDKSLRILIDANTIPDDRGVRFSESEVRSFFEQATQFLGEVEEAVDALSAH